MRVDDFDFDLPEENIALRPAIPRDSAKLLLVDGCDDGFADCTVRDLPGLLRPGDCLVFNDTKVVPTQLFGVRKRDGLQHANISATLHKRLTAADWLAFVKGAKKLQVGDCVSFENDCAALNAEVIAKHQDGNVALRFEKSEAQFDELLARIGHMPLPPYIAGRRGTDDQDRDDYQTVYARQEGAVAAPTAGLHFTQALLDALDERGIERVFVTLHVGSGTFLPMKVDDTNDHVMHAEWGSVSEEVARTINMTRANGGRIVCVGTTSLRLMESAADEAGALCAWEGETDIFITPGYRFRCADGLMTNFHLPKSTLFMLVSAFCGLETMRSAYEHAITNGYRFYSYGDASLLWKQMS